MYIYLLVFVCTLIQPFYVHLFTSVCMYTHTTILYTFIGTKMSLSCEFKFCSAVLGYHVYRDTWKPYVSECLRCEHEIDNLFDMIAIKVCLDNSIVGHLPREISRATKFLLDRGALINATIRSTIVRRSPLFQGGLEVLCTVEVSMPKTVKSQELMNRYQGSRT